MFIFLSAGALVIGFVLVVVGIEKRFSELRLMREGTAVVGTVVEVRRGHDNDTFALVEYVVDGQRYTREFANYPASVGQAIELLADSRSPRAAQIRETLPQRVRAFGCFQFVGVLAILAGVTGLVVFFTLMRPR